MNANELADCLNKMATILYNRGRIATGSDYNLMYKAETMLRQQQEKLTKYELRNIAQCDRIAHLEAKLSEALDAENDRRFE